MDVNYFGVVRITQKFLPLVRAHKGRIINVSSVAGFISGALQGPYSASKFALEALTDSLRRELNPLGVAVVSINPAAVQSKLGEKYVSAAKGVNQALAPVYSHVVGSHVDAVFQRFIDKSDSAQVTTDVIDSALFLAQPSDRYVVANIDGIPAGIIVFLARTLPTYLFDKLMAEGMK
jgi:NAD(P)-dependent dehydrogenase (short-subunit alcohol dehydrogenase family)